MTFTELQLKIQNAKDLDFGDIFNRSIELFKKVWVQGLVMTILTMALMIPFYIIMYLPLIAMGLFDPQALESGEPNFALMIPFYLMMMVFSFFAMVIGFALKAAFLRICKMKDLDEVGKEDYFYFLKKPYLGKVFSLSLISFGISLAATLLCVLPLFYVMVPIALMNVIFAFNPHLSPSEITKAAFNLGNKKWLITFGLMFVSGMLAQVVGILMCFIGVLVTASFTVLPLYYIYKDSVGLDEKEIDRIGEGQQF
ncbi:hypothetical protein [Meridianimaribacter flavus]|uniref:Glycerophosphoryl diester phosphodiesterase membrane domain-containing protein n=1 Tax=Meridianimaribacter flavus TaxID=571115 RepID=A0ABY2G8J2_9FLAO|nr:hypothetical protein [Meridianimaribacter flavus]TDY14125.1 hypothetical protein A8975_0726 [Meridianimaribacter flavus]